MKASPGIMLIWRFAKAEAGRSEHECIEPEHFVAAMTRGETLTDDEMLNRRSRLGGGEGCHPPVEY